VKDVLKTIIEKGRFAQWLGIIVCGGIAYAGGEGGWLDSKEVVEIVSYGVMLAGGIELMKQLGGKGIE